MRLVRLILFASLLALGVTSAWAQSVRWERSADPGEVILTYENCKPTEEPTLPALPNTEIVRTGHSTRTESINFRQNVYVDLTYRFRVANNGKLTIPAFNVATDKGTLRVAAYPPPTTDTARSRLEPTKLTVWAGEIFPLTYTLDVARRSFTGNISDLAWNSSPLVTEEWSKPDPKEAVVDGETRLHVAYRSRGYIKTPGTVSLNAVSQSANFQLGNFGFGPFGQARVEQIAVETNRPELTVRPLPTPPAGFGGAVGDFKFTSKIVPEKAAIGEPVTWTLELTGTGNWPEVAGLPARDVSNDFQVVQPKAKRTPAEGKLFDVTLGEDVVLIPTKAGTYTLGPVAFTYFDPKTGGYKTVTAPRTTVTITPPVASPFAAAQPTKTGTAASDTDKAAPEVATAPTARALTPPTPPAAIPRDPLPGFDLVSAPLSRRTLLVGLIAPLVLPFGVWLWLAIRRASETDPVRPRREARRRLLDTLNRLHSAEAADRPALILAWQRDTAVLWQVALAAPSATSLPDKKWSDLWLEADRALYGAQATLPTDWVARAQEALVAKRLPGFQPLGLFLPRNLFPFAAVLAMTTLIALPLLQAATDTDALVAYRSGNFASAEKNWRSIIEAAPTNWIARHNLSLALAQQERPGEAAGQAAAAFVQNPSSPAVRSQLAFAADKAGVAPAGLSTFLVPGPVESLARRASPASWQRYAIAAAVVLALALAGLLANAYTKRQRGLFFASTAVLALSLLFGALALVAARAYGKAADPRAVVVATAGVLRSIPTEVDTTQKTTPLAAGSLAIVDHTFLDWRRLVFENGQTGWARKTDLVPLWK